MTRVFVDQREIPIPPEGISSLDQILTHIEHTLLPSDIIIRQINIDGIPVGAEDFGGGHSSRLTPVEQNDRIDIFTGNIGRIALDSIGEAIAYLDKLKTVIPSLAMNLQNTPGPGPFGELKQFYEGFYWLSILVRRLETTFHIDSTSVKAGTISAAEQLVRFETVIGQLVEAQEQGDFVLLAALLEHEVLPLLPEWKEMFDMFGERLGTTP